MNTKRNLEYWVIPPEANGEFVAHMEDVLEVYSRPYEPHVPVLCMDEQPVQLVEEARQPIAATADHPKRVDYEYKRAGVANIFMFAEPLACWREVSVRAQKTKADWALEMGALLEGRYADCEKVIVVCDNLNTHTMGAFYEVFEPLRARAIVSRIEFHYTPKHGSWLNIAENELSCLTSQCVSGRRIGSEAELREETTAWSTDINSTQRGVDWQMKIDDARRKLKSVYPKIEVQRGFMSADTSSGISMTFVEPVMSPVRLAVASAFRLSWKADATAGRMGRPPFVEPEPRSVFTQKRPCAHKTSLNRNSVGRIG